MSEIDMNDKKWHDDVSIDLLNKLTITEINYALLNMTNRRYERKPKNQLADKTQHELWTILKRLGKIESKLLEEFPANG